MQAKAYTYRNVFELRYGCWFSFSSSLLASTSTLRFFHHHVCAFLLGGDMLLLDDSSHECSFGKHTRGQNYFRSNRVISKGIMCVCASIVVSQSSSLGSGRKRKRERERSRFRFVFPSLLAPSCCWHAKKHGSQGQIVARVRIYLENYFGSTRQDKGINQSSSAKKLNGPSCGMFVVIVAVLDLAACCAAALAFERMRLAVAVL